jgi:hypothetical protein
VATDKLEGFAPLGNRAPGILNKEGPGLSRAFPQQSRNATVQLIAKQ